MNNLISDSICIAVISLLASVQWAASETSNPTLGDCVFHRFTQDNAAIDRLKRLQGMKFSVKDDSSSDPTESYIYEVSICEQFDSTKDSADTELREAGALQTVIKDGEAEPNPNILGSMKKADVMHGSNWIYLEYSAGKKYGSHCGGAPRQTLIMITCNPNEFQGKQKLLEENNNKTASCYYMFEYEHAAACPNVSLSSSFSIGTILIIVFIVLVTVYLLGGFIYQRFVVGAKGLEQIPNFTFWQDFGNLQADGCDLVCRCGTRYQDSGTQPYRGIGDDQLRTTEDEEDDRDEHLLPM